VVDQIVSLVEMVLMVVLDIRMVTAQEVRAAGVPEVEEVVVQWIMDNQEQMVETVVHLLPPAQECPPIVQVQLQLSLLQHQQHGVGRQETTPVVAADMVPHQINPTEQMLVIKHGHKVAVVAASMLPPEVAISVLVVLVPDNCGQIHQTQQITTNSSAVEEALLAQLVHHQMMDMAEKVS
jgi:hypothetical protein